MKYSHRFFLYAPVAAVIALAIAVSAYWYVTANAFSKRLEALNGHEVAPGVTFRYDYKTIGGFPFRVDAVLTNMRVEIATPHGPARWKAAHFALHMLDYGSLQFVFEAAGKQVVSWHGANGKAEGVDFTPALLRASASVHKGRLARFDLEMIGAAMVPLSVAKAELHMRQDPDRDALDLYAMADDVHLAPTLRTAIGDVISKIRFKAALAPSGPWHALLSGNSGWRKAADDWRKKKGSLDIVQLDLAMGKTEAAGAGTLMLDNAHRPYGMIKLKVAGYQALADEAARQHLVQGAQKGILAGIMAEAAANGGDRAGRLPVTLAFKDGLAYVGHTPAGFLDPVY